MSEISLSPGLQFFGNLVDLDCHIQDLKLVLRKTEEIEFPYHEDAAEGESLIADIFPDITRKGFIVTLLIALDDQFKVYCEILKKATSQHLKWNDLKGSALERFITYSEKVCGLKSVCDDLIRQQLVGLIEVRNCIVHNNSGIEGFSKRNVIERFSNQMEGVNIQEGYITLELVACNNCADIVLKFMEQAYHSALEVFPYEH
ncbi:MAG: hypothetical protein O7C73_02345 [Nitrospirae bacterium]|nr:hypothetical protein [Nitrospirota bacterium]